MRREAVVHDLDLRIGIVLEVEVPPGVPFGAAVGGHHQVVVAELLVDGAGVIRQLLGLCMVSQ